ncbi:MAG: hypothetical protein RR494_08040 [Vagococcus sp.]
MKQVKETAENFKLLFGPAVGCFLMPLIFGIPSILSLWVLRYIWDLLFR